MEYVITRLCRDCVDGSCVEVCPVDAILVHHGTPKLPNQLFIEPDLCIYCGACEPECPWDAIFELDDVPALFHDDIALNRRTVDYPDEYEVPTELSPPRIPELAAVQANKERWIRQAQLPHDALSAGGE